MEWVRVVPNMVLSREILFLQIKLNYYFEQLVNSISLGTLGSADSRLSSWSNESTRRRREVLQDYLSFRDNLKLLFNVIIDEVWKFWHISLKSGKHSDKNQYPPNSWNQRINSAKNTRSNHKFDFPYSTNTNSCQKILTYKKSVPRQANSNPRSRNNIASTHTS